MSSTIKIAIAGFTGKMARSITSYLLRNHPNVEIHGIARSVDKVDASLRAHPKVKVFEAKSTDATNLRLALAGTSACICCYLGDDSLMVEGQITLIDACIAEKVPRYIASDWSIDFRGLKFKDHPTKDAMKHVQAYLEEKENEGKIRAVHVLNGAFTEIVFAPFTGFLNTAEGVANYFGTGDEPLEMTTYEDAANFTAEVAIDSSANGFLNILGDRKSVKQLAQLYEEAYGATLKPQRLGSLQDLKDKMTAAFEAAPDNPYAWMGMFYQYYMTNGSTWLGKLDNERYPFLKPVSVATFLNAHTKETVGNSAFF